MITTQSTPAIQALTIISASLQARPTCLKRLCSGLEHSAAASQRYKSSQPCGAGEPTTESSHRLSLRAHVSNCDCNRLAYCGKGEVKILNITDGLALPKS